MKMVAVKEDIWQELATIKISKKYKNLNNVIELLLEEYKIA
jgi:hypothetical protein